jgi:hypothetical protein
MDEIWYRCPEECEDSYYRLINTFCGKESLSSIAQEAADDYHSNHDDWGSSWPLIFSLHETEGGPELARFEVERELEPVFYATLKE